MSLTGIKMATYCFGCGDDVTNSKVKQSLYIDASKHVRPLWFEIFDKELASKGLEAQASHKSFCCSRREECPKDKATQAQIAST